MELRKNRQVQLWQRQGNRAKLRSLSKRLRSRDRRSIKDLHFGHRFDLNVIDMQFPMWRDLLERFDPAFNCLLVASFVFPVLALGFVLALAPLSAADKTTNAMSTIA